MRSLKQLFLMNILLLLLMGCVSKDGMLTQAFERSQLDQMLNELIALMEREPCANAADWKIVPAGDKACGGPTSFLAYSVSMDTTAFLNKVEDYTAAEKAYNLKWGIISDCSLLLAPSGVLCDSGKVVLVY